jgi:hypothetical protein
VQLSEKAIEQRRKLNLTKLKGKAEGKATVPESQRFYLTVVHGRDEAVSYPACFSCNMTVGQVIDAAAERLRVRNQNHKPVPEVRPRLASFAGVVQ